MPHELEGTLEGIGRGLIQILSQNLDRAMAQAVSRWFPTATAWIRARVRSCGICGRQSCTGAGFSRVLRFSLPILIPPIAPQYQMDSVSPH
jgi:hypothetical protein